MIRLALWSSSTVLLGSRHPLSQAQSGLGCVDTTCSLLEHPHLSYPAGLDPRWGSQAGNSHDAHMKPSNPAALEDYEMHTASALRTQIGVHHKHSRTY